jgi:hypothetical protein
MKTLGNPNCDPFCEFTLGKYQREQAEDDAKEREIQHPVKFGRDVVYNRVIQNKHDYGEYSITK